MNRLVRDMRYISLFLHIVKINSINLMMYRTNFFMNIIDSLIWFAITLIFFNTLYGYVENVNGWSIYEIYLLLGTSELLKSFIFVLFINNLPYIPSLVNKGTLDLLLLKPVNSQFIASLRKLDMGNFGNLFPAIALIIYALAHLNVMLHIHQILEYLLFILTGVVLAYSLWIITMTLSIWFTKVDGLHELFLGAMTLFRYPTSFFKGIGKIIFVFVFPIVIVANVPVERLLQVSHETNMLHYFLYVGGFLVFSAVFWKISLKYYQSAGG
ncbi:ABC-2 family transporter protein [Bacillus sonorensis]|nr:MULTISPECIES: ABC-2 family transporter protein [Bacillus]MCF7618234.1 ABC-2 family transporter protein [Bacillus sonorensis]MCY7856954.1 ABC-2 family transporter protein [Bacillus sonorensis]MCY8024513.1 ABC-2 family transporter protein [Bacillus sonorensis]MCY8035893.1 ABC-2 family transporter protein [Bacillus sonorensis]MCY8089450.1 ABC-2 family transporter protein [Bacillus sonorensis]